MKSIIICIALVMFFITTSVYATIIYIPNDQPTIQAGIESSIDGDTVLVHPGTYIENINFNGKEICVASFYLTTLDRCYISETIIDGNAINAVVEFNTNENQNSKIIGFTLTNGFNFEGGGIQCWHCIPVSFQLKVDRKRL